MSRRVAEFKGCSKEHMQSQSLSLFQSLSPTFVLSLFFLSLLHHNQTHAHTLTFSLLLSVVNLVQCQPARTGGDHSVCGCDEPWPLHAIPAATTGGEGFGSDVSQEGGRKLI